MNAKEISKDVDKMTEVLFSIVDAEFNSERELKAVLKNCKKYSAFKKHCRHKIQISMELNGITYFPATVANKVAVSISEMWWNERERLLGNG